MLKTLVASAAIALIATAAQAADAVQSVDSDVLPPEEISSFTLLAGAGVSVQPLYEGSDEYRVAAFPILAPSFGGSVNGPRRFEFRGLDDIRIHALYLGNLSVGPLAGYRFGRDQDDAARLNGLGDIDGGLVVGGFANYDFIATPDTRFGTDLAISSQVTGDVFGGTPFDRGTDYGYEIDGGLSLEHQLTQHLRVSGRVGLVWASDEYMNTNFSVTPAQAAASVLTAYDADAGVKNAYVQAAATYRLTERFELRGGVGYSRLVSDAADSPVVADPNQFSGFAGAAYRFKF